MKTIFINNKIQLIENYTYIEVKVICPKSNIQKMLDATKSKFISKTEISLNYNHLAGQVFEVVIKARFENVEQFLKKQSIANYYRSAENYNAYIDMVSINGFFHSNTCFETEIVSLYAFGDCSRLTGNGNTYTRYFRKDGHSILRCDNDFTENGNKRYIKTNKGWLTNRAF